MEPKVVVDQPEVEDQLSQMRLDRAGMLGVIAYAKNEWALCTGYDPVGFASTMAYAKAGRRLREIYVPKKTGWIAANWNNQCGISNPDLKIRIVPCNFDQHAGNRLVLSTNKSPKGEVTRKKTLCNRTAFFPGIFDDEPKPNDELNDGFQNWVLGLFFDESKPNGAELSLPVGITGNHFTRFATRIILVDSSDERDTPEKRNESGDAVEIVDISITKK